MLTSYVKKILQAKVYDVAQESNLDFTPTLSKRLNNRILVKREDSQQVFSFKIRGAYNKMANLPPEILARGVITASAGNHAQGVALSANYLNIDALIVMPKTTPEIKVDAVRNWGAKILLHGNSYDDAGIYAKKLAVERGLAFIHPYDDPDVIAGQGTIGMEILHQHSNNIDAIFVPVGGGGLIAGIAAYVKYIRPGIKIIGVEPDDAGCLHAALQAGERVILDQVGIFADGVAVRQIGKAPFELAKEYVDEVILVNTDEICAAIKDIFEATRVVMEPAGALALAGLKSYIHRTAAKGQTFITIASGANMNFDRLQHIAERTEVSEQREALMAVTIPEQSGSFRDFCHTLGLRTLTEFNYRYSHNEKAQIFVGVRLDGGDEKQKLQQKLTDHQYSFTDLSDNEIAKTHVRHMVGGHSSCMLNERIYRIEFPERPGALLYFLTELGDRWNISLFHYRNHGAAFGRILMGIQILDEALPLFYATLDHLGYAYWNEDDNPAYRLFLN
ncbi:MAG: threonine ammonia-lyase, biosynthetic [Pseudomonadota bacterium]